MPYRKGNAMQVVMSKKKPGRPKSATPPKEKILAMRVPDDLYAVLEAYRAAQKFPPDRTTVGLRALEQFLRAEGFAVPPRRHASS